MYQIAVCDDEQSDLYQSVQLTERILQEAEIPCDVTAYGSGVDLLREIQQGRHFDLLLLDVIMDALDGMALASHLKEQAAPPDIVFISTDRDMALLGYHVNAKRYLAKPLDRDELREALLHCYQEMRRRTGGSEQLLLPTDTGQLRVSLRDIRYAEPSGRHTCLHLTEGQEIVRLPLSRLAERLPESQFIYCHRTVLVNLAFVHRLRQRDLELTSGEILPVSRYRFAQVRQALLNLLDA